MSELNPCSMCGNKPDEIVSRMAEDAMGIWYSCRCGNAGEVIEDAYIFDGMAEAAALEWNRANPKGKSP